MSRKNLVEAESEIVRAHETRLLYLSRNHEFRNAIDSLTTLRDALPGEPGAPSPERLCALQMFRAKLEQAGKEWGVPWDLLSQLSWHEWQNSGHPKDRISAASVFFGSPVIAWTDTPSPFVSLVHGEPSESNAEDSRYLNLRVDLDHAVHTLVPLIEREVSQFSQERRRGRRRLSQVRFYLQVFDLAESGETFKAIASKLKKRSSTVKSAFLAARRNIFGPASPSKKDLPLANFDKDTHIQKCPVCLNAESVEEMCPAAQRYALQDQKSQREMTGFNPTR